MSEECCQDTVVLSDVCHSEASNPNHYVFINTLASKQVEHSIRCVRREYYLAARQLSEGLISGEYRTLEMVVQTEVHTNG